MPQQTVLILGGGVGGVVAANALRRRLHRRHRVVLVDREPSFALAASVLWIMNGTRVPEQISRPLARLTRKGIEVIRGEIERIDPARKQAVGGGRTFEAEPSAPWTAPRACAACWRTSVRDGCCCSRPRRLTSAQPPPTRGRC